MPAVNSTPSTGAPSGGLKAATAGMKSFNIASQHKVSVRVHPVAILTILDSYLRRPDGASRTIGTLLGYIAENKTVVEITDCFPVVHQDTEDRGVLMDQDYHRQMLSLRQKVSPKEIVIGWFSTGNEITDSSVVVHSFYCTKDSKFTPTPQLPGPVHLLVDTELKNNALGIKAFVNVHTSVADNLAQFHEVPLEVSQGNPTEKAGIALLLAARNEKKTGKKDEKSEEEKKATTTDGFEGGLKELQDLFRKARAYTQKVIDGEMEPNLQVGRGLTRTLCNEPIFDLDSVQNLCQGALQDTLMVVYLSNLTRTQISLAEKINKEFAPAFMDF